MEKLPPKEKIYEAYSALADGRIHMGADGLSATVTSSDGAKEYKLKWSGDRYVSTDSATWWQGYPGYPVLAVLMLQGKLSYDEKVAALFSGIDWHTINAAHKRDYAAAAAEVLDGLEKTGADMEAVTHAVDRVWNEVIVLPISVTRKL